MKIAVLARPDAWHFNDLRRAAGDRHHLIAIDYASLFSTIAIRVGSKQPGHKSPTGIYAPTFGDDIVELNSFDALIIRSMPAGSLEQVVFRMDLLGKLADSNVSVINSPRTIEASVDKFLSLALLHGAGVPVPETIVCQRARDAIDGFDRLGGDVVLKPVFGSGGRGLERLRSAADAALRFRELESESRVYYLQSFVDHNDRDIRALVIGDRVFGMLRESPGDWITNAGRGAQCSAFDLDDRHRELAVSAAKAVGGSFIGVDILCDASDSPLVVEVNACPGWRAFSRATGIDVGEGLLELVSNSTGQNSWADGA